jgi:glycosyltransferase involved in cell wall biosynthesis
MRLLFATDRFHVPDDFSGSVQSTHALILGLLQRNHDCEVVAALRPNWRHYLATGVHRLSAQRIVMEWHDRGNGYVVHRGSPWRFVERVVRRLRQCRADVLILDSMRMLRALEAAGFEPPCPIAVVMHDVGFVRESNSIPFGRRTCIVANSPYTAAVVTAHFGIEPPVVPPVVHLGSYVTGRPDARALTLVSPHARKGLDLALEIAARLPEIPLLLVEGWPLASAQRKALERRISPLGNVRLQSSTADMRGIYRQTWLQLVPSELETFGRVVVEAQMSGIPVLSSDAGALPWVVGSGGVVFSGQQTVGDWVSCIEGLRDATRYDALSRKAAANATRDDFQPEQVVERFEAVLRRL